MKRGNLVYDAEQCFCNQDYCNAAGSATLSALLTIALALAIVG